MTGDEYEEFLREDQQARLARFYKARPPAFAKRGWLNRNVHQWLEGMIRGENRTLALEGPTGTGKSWSLWKSVETLLANGWRGRWEIITATDFAEVIRRRWTTPGCAGSGSASSSASTTWAPGGSRSGALNTCTRSSTTGASRNSPWLSPPTSRTW